MAKRLVPSTVAACCLLSSSAWGATLLEFHSGDGQETQKMWVEGELARVEGGGAPGSYSIFDMKNGRLYGIEPAQKHIVEYDLAPGTGKPTRSSGPTARVATEDKGTGPKLAGYATRHYLLTADGETCGEYFLSKDALADAGMRDVLGGLKRLSDAQEDGDGYDPCDQAETYMIGEYLKLGLPLRQLDAEGELDHEIVRIEKNARMPAGGTALPKGYQRISMEQYVQQMMQRYQEQQKGK